MSARQVAILHVPAGATPEDGPSGGVTLAFGGKPQHDFAMTAELTPTGQALPVGGIMEKVIATRRAGAKRPVLPEANQRDYDEVPQPIRENLTVYFATRCADVAAQVFPA